MATIGGEVTKTPTNLVSTHSLADDTKYVLQNTGAAEIFLHENSSAPTISSRKMIIEALGMVFIQPSTGVGVYVWNTNGYGSYVINNAI